MKKTLFSTALIIFALVFAAYGMRDKQLMVDKPSPEVIDQMTPSASTEIALAEELAQTRLAYHKQLEKIKSFYEQSGNQMKIEWVQRELKALDSIPRYRYILQAEVAGEPKSPRVGVAVAVADQAVGSRSQALPGRKSRRRLPEGKQAGHVRESRPAANGRLLDHLEPRKPQDDDRGEDPSDDSASHQSREHQ